ncbi:AAA family ATPase [Alteromonas sp. ASW11-36]|uniref:AAA family ATPase n=1 Tax=Alteromonas arenosi TaxID=3055817 RepID=A0ABT7SWJ4_9ALTE|nr:AAA family ATPase [Alteromonas sp. ASW11-36]MDM7860557.1 AAA family ATPase [Alteromonas sp. ASW11-36]
MYQLAVKVKGYKCFHDEAGFDSIQRVNLIIGRNNSGKSSLLDLIDKVTSRNYEFDRSTWRENQPPQVIFQAEISERAVTNTFPRQTHGGEISGNHNEYGQKYIGKTIKWSKRGEGRNNNAQLIECNDEGIQPSLLKSGGYHETLPNNMLVPLEGKNFRRLLAERDILPEPANTTDINISTNGSGLTNAIQCFINKSGLPSELVEQDILEGLNEIFAHDACFTDIVCQQHESLAWEIYLEEEHKGRIPLSQSGSGLKTVMSVLACLILVPHLEHRPLGSYVFGFEELENNIHPALLRRLNEYIYKSSKEHDFIYFLTTHSNVLIDQFSKQSDAQIVHVTHNQQSSFCKTAQTYIENNGILDDLDIRASDILQSNGVIWVEGPSDRIYLNRWIHLWSDGALKEGTHYQIVFYGGRLLSHLSARNPDEAYSGISILNANRNALILIDSDKRNKQSRINDTKKRIRDEFDKLGAFCWITRGKEIENFIPLEVVNARWSLEATQHVGMYDNFFDYLEQLVPGEGKKYSGKKTLMAEEVIPFMTKENLSEILDIDEMMRRTCRAIESWNS